MDTDETIEHPHTADHDGAADAPPSNPVGTSLNDLATYQPPDEEATRDWYGMTHDEVLLAPAFTVPPMRLPDETWALLVVAVDVTADDAPERPGTVALFSGTWVPTQPPADICNGDLVLRLTPPDDPMDSAASDGAADIEMLLAHHGRWRRVGRWFGVDGCWPIVVAPTAAAIMALHGETAESLPVLSEPDPLVPTSSRNFTRGGVAELIAAGIVRPGEEFLWERRRLCVRHAVRIRDDGMVVLTDGRAYANPTSATNALGGYNENGWTAFRRVTDGRTLADLRADMVARRGH